jgi:hypothetical protein
MTAEIERRTGGLAARRVRWSFASGVVAAAVALLGGAS